MRIAGVLIALLALAACSKHDARGDARAAETAVRELFAAFAARDCDRLAGRIGGTLRDGLEKGGCEHTVDELAKLELVSVEQNRADGRAPGVRLIHVLLRGHQEPSVLRVQNVDGRWLVVGM